ncbi:flagellar hook-length control protein FliK [uncultured Jannaschia sp.]|uniref:flagellar hook-length control protein FliK n=1 Tax=uncultured Jannaschia sp. TaxID=293347 RepID=UPI00261755CF|nr:flagellar hook-length control protein FliK [uncultured Jannaschia sp.]
MTPEFLTALTPSTGKSAPVAPADGATTEQGDENGATFESLLAALTAIGTEIGREGNGPAREVKLEMPAEGATALEGEIAGHAIPDWLRAALDAVERPARPVAGSDTPDSSPTSEAAEPTTERATPSVQATAQSSANAIVPTEETPDIDTPEADPEIKTQAPPSNSAPPANVAPLAAGVATGEQARDRPAAQVGIVGTPGSTRSEPRRHAADATSSRVPQADARQGDAVPVPPRAFVEPGSAAPAIPTDGQRVPDETPAGAEPKPGSSKPELPMPAANTTGTPANPMPSPAPDTASTTETVIADTIPEPDAVTAGREETRAEPRPGTPELRAVPLPELRGGIVQRLQELAAKAEADGVTLRNGPGELSTELELAPAELGKLKLTLATTERGLSLVVHVERPESVEAVRRQLEGLHRTLLSEGLALDGFDISGGRDRREAALPRDRTPAGEAADSSDALPDTPHPAIAAPAVPRGRLDIRI